MLENEPEPADAPAWTLVSAGLSAMSDVEMPSTLPAEPIPDTPLIGAPVTCSTCRVLVNICLAAFIAVTSAS